MLSDTDLDFTDVQELSKAAASFLDESMETMGISSTGQLSPAIVEKSLKRDLSHIAHYALIYLADFIAMTTDHNSGSSCMKSEMIHLQQSVTKLQAELLTYKDN